MLDPADVYARYLPVAEAVALRITRNHADAADAAQDALLAVLRRLPELDLETLRLEAYVRAAARNHALQQLRGRRSVTDLVETQPDPGPSPHELCERRDTARRVRGALRALPDRQRRALFAQAYEERDSASIGDELGICANAANQLLFRARVTLARELAA